MKEMVEQAVAPVRIPLANKEQALRTALDGMAQAQRAGFDAEARAVAATPMWRGVIEVADEIEATAIVIGAKARNGLQALFEESPLHKLVQHARRPILIVPAGLHASSARGPAPRAPVA
jgi:nucleotide-binding universal stress UspA family protein